MTFLELAYKTLEQNKAPLSIQQIWEISQTLGFQEKLSSAGKTPIKTLAARIYLDIRDNPNTQLYQYSKRPATFYIKNLEIIENPNTSENASKNKSRAFKERDLHPILSSFAYTNHHFNCVTKTIFHEKSKKKQKGENEWLHPDIVGLYFPFTEYCNSTTDFINAINDSIYKIYSFELKIQVNFSNLREYFFQAVSNSSWANEGYLVALDYDEDTELQEEMLRLNNAFGIGFIKLNPNNVEQSEILFPAKINENIDWDTVDRLCETNPDFDSFIKSSVADIKGNQIHLSEYDKILVGESMDDYIKTHNII